MKYYTQSYHKKSPFLSNYFFLVAFELLIFLVFCAVFFVFFVFVLCRVHPMLPVSLDCPFLITSSVLSDAYFMYKNPIAKEIKYIESSALYFTSLQRFNIGTAGSFYSKTPKTRLSVLQFYDVLQLFQWNKEP